MLQSYGNYSIYRVCEDNVKLHQHPTEEKRTIEWLRHNNHR